VRSGSWCASARAEIPQRIPTRGPAYPAAGTGRATERTSARGSLRAAEQRPANQRPAERGSDVARLLRRRAVRRLGPTLVEQASSDGRWVALCQARKDEAGKEALRRYLVAPGEELASRRLAQRNGGRSLVLFLQNGVLLLWASETRKTVDLSALGADARLSAESNATLRVLDFDSTSERLLYLRRSANGNRIVLRTLSDGTERELDPGPGRGVARRASTGR